MHVARVKIISGCMNKHLPLRKLVAMAAALWMGSLSCAMAQTLVVNWGGKYLPDGVTSATLDYGSHTVVDTPLTGTSVRRNWLYSPTVKLSPSPSQYIPAPGRSGTFYGALQNIDSRGGYTYSRARVDANGASDTLYLWGSDPGAGQTSKITGLIYFTAEDFLGAESGQTFSLATTNSFSLQGSMAGDSRRLRFAVLNAGVWYISNTSFGSGTSWTLNNAANDLWAVWDPTGGELQNILNNSALDFSVSGESLLNIQAVGFAYELTRGTNSPRLSIDHFQVELMAIPEGKTATLMLGAGAMLMAARQIAARRRSTATRH